MVINGEVAQTSSHRPPPLTTQPLIPNHLVTMKEQEHHQVPIVLYSRYRHAIEGEYTHVHLMTLPGAINK